MVEVPNDLVPIQSSVPNDLTPIHAAPSSAPPPDLQPIAPEVRNMVAAGAAPDYAFKRFNESQANPSAADVTAAQAERDNPGFHPITAIERGAVQSAGPLIGAVNPELANQGAPRVNERFPVQPTMANRAMEIVGSALPDLPALGLGAAATPYFVAKGAISGVGSARMQAEQQRQAGQDISAADEAKAATGYGLIGGAAGVVPGRIVGRLAGEATGPIASRVARGVAENTAIGGAMPVAENVVAQHTIDPNRPTMQGAAEGLASGAITGAVFTGVGEAGRAIANRGAPDAAPVEATRTETIPNDLQPIREQPPADLQPLRLEAGPITPVPLQEGSRPRAPEAGPPRESEAPAPDFIPSLPQPPERVPQQHDPLELERALPKQKVADKTSFTSDEVFNKYRDLHLSTHPDETERIQKHPKWKLETLRVSDIPLDNDRVRDPDYAREQYAHLTTTPPPIVMDDAGIIDGMHRVWTAKYRGDETIQAYVPESFRTPESAPPAQATAPPHTEALQGDASRPAQPKAEPAASKQPWEMTQQEYWKTRPSGDVKADIQLADPTLAKWYADHPNGTHDTVRSADIHEHVVKAAIAAGHPVPAEVLADYPELARPAPDAKPSKPKPPPGEFTRQGLEQHLLAKHAEQGGGFTADDDAAWNELGTGPTTFYKKLPGEVETMLEGRPHLQKMFDVTNDPAKAGGEDAMSTLGQDRYLSLVEARAERNRDTVAAAVESAKNSGDTDLATRAQLYEAIKSGDKETADSLRTQLKAMEKATPEQAGAFPFNEPSKIEQWAQSVLTEAKQQRAKRSETLAELPAGRRRLRGGGDIEVRELIASAIVHGAPLIRKGFRTFSEWSKFMLQKFPDMTRQALQHAFRYSRRLANIPTEDQRSAWISKQLDIPQEKTTKQIVRENVDGKAIQRAVKEFDALRMRMRTEAAAAQPGEAKAAIAKLVRENLPASEQGKLLPMIEAAETPGDVRRATAYAGQLARAADKRVAMREYKDVIGSFDPDKIKPSFRDAAKKIIDAYSPVKTKSETQGRLRAMLDFAAKNPDNLIPPEMLAQAQRTLSTTKLADLPAREVRAATDALKAIKHQAETYDKLRINHQARQAAQVVAESLKTFDGKPPLQAARSIERDSSGQPIVEPQRGMAGRYMEQRRNSDSIAFEMDNGKSGPWTETLHNPLRRGRDEAHDIRFAAQDRLGKVLDTDDIAWGSKKLEQFAQERIETPTAYTPERTATGTKYGRKTVSLTRAQRIELAGSLLDTETRQKIIGNGFKVRGATGDRDAYRVDEQWAKKFLTGLDPRERKIVDAMRAEYNGDLKKQQNDVFARMLGYEPLIKDDYYPSRADRTEAQTGAPENSAAAIRMYLESMGIYKQRENHGLPMVIGDAFDTFRDHTWSSANFIANAENLHAAWTLIGTPEVRRKIVQTYGADRLSSLKDFISQAAMNKGNPETEAATRALGTLAGNAAKYVLSTPSAAAKQLTGIPTLMADLGVTPVLRSLKTIAANPKLLASTWNDLKQSGLMRSRYEGDGTLLVSPQFEQERPSYGRRSFGEQIKSINPTDWAKAINEHALDPMQAMDYVNAVVAFHATDPSLPVKERAYIASESINRTQNASDPIDYSPGQIAAKTSLMARVNNMFGSQATAVWNLMRRQQIEYVNSDRSTKAKAKLVAGTVLVLGSQAVLSNLIGKGVRRGMYGPEKEEDKAKMRLGLDIVEDALQTMLGNLPAKAGRKFLDSLFDRSLRGGIFDAVSTRGIEGLIESPHLFIEAVGASIDHDPKAFDRWLKFADRFWNSSGQVFGQAWMNVAYQSVRSVGRRVMKPAPEDSRIVAKREATKQATERRKSLDTEVQHLLTEKNRLDALPAKSRTQAEKDRHNALASLEKHYYAWQKYEKKKNVDNAAYHKKGMDAALKKLHEPKK